MTTRAPKFGGDPMDVYSIPLVVEKTRLTKLITMSVREKAEKPGRALVVVWDERVPVNGIKNRYAYVVTFSGVGKFAGNHYHHQKEELLYPVAGTFRVILEDVESKEREAVVLKTSEHKVLYLPHHIAHVVVAETNPAILLVNATYPNNEEDEFSYPLVG